MVLLVGWEPGDWLLARKQAGNTAPIEGSRRRALQHGALSSAVQCSACVCVVYSECWQCSWNRPSCASVLTSGAATLHGCCWQHVDSTAL